MRSDSSPAVSFPHSSTTPRGRTAPVPPGFGIRLPGFPRPGDNFVVDAAAGVPNQNALTGGEVGTFPNPHYRDEFDLWALNQTHAVHSTDTALLPDAEGCLLLEKP